MSIPNVYDPDFEAAFVELLLAAADSAEFADGRPIGRSRSVSLRRLRSALAQLETVSKAIVLRAPVVDPGELLSRLAVARTPLQHT